MQHLRWPPPPDTVASGVTNRVTAPALAPHTGQSHRGSVITRHPLMTQSPPQTARRNALTSAQNLPKNLSIFSTVQAHVEGSAPPVSDATTTLSPNVKEQSYETEPQAQPGKTICHKPRYWSTMDQYRATLLQRKQAQDASLWFPYRFRAGWTAGNSRGHSLVQSPECGNEFNQAWESCTTTG